MTDLRRDIEAIYRAALSAVHAGNAVRANLKLSSGGSLRVGHRQVEIGPAGVFAIAMGKAAVGMIDAVAASLGDAFTAGIAVSKSEAASSDMRVKVVWGSHPVPDSRSLDAGDAVLDFAGAVPEGALVLCLISGGGSSLVESLREGDDLDRLREVTSTLLHAGATIHELNAVRSRMSRIKAGGLLSALSHTRVHNLIVSDVLGDDLQTIASGPTVPAIDANAEMVAQRYRVSGTIPPAPTRNDAPLPPTTIVANLTIALDACVREASERGYTSVVLTGSMDGEASEAGRLFASVLADTSVGKTSFGGRTCLLAGGETTVTVRGRGTGGRNTEAALSAAIRLSGAVGIAVGFLATDGDDGTTGVAGAIVDGATVGVVSRAAAKQALADNDSFTFLRRVGADVKTGPTGTNVNDLVIGLVE
jgi:glycerate 2-kinase